MSADFFSQPDAWDYRPRGRPKGTGRPKGGERRTCCRCGQLKPRKGGGEADTPDGERRFTCRDCVRAWLRGAN